MTTITIDNAILEQAIDALAGYRRELGDSQPCDAEQELCAALAAQPSNYSDWQQRRGVLADIVDEALASYEAWMAEDDYNATDALHKIMDHMRQRAASYAKPAQQPAPAWHDAPEREAFDALIKDAEHIHVPSAEKAWKATTEDQMSDCQTCEREGVCDYAHKPCDCVHYRKFVAAPMRPCDDCIGSGWNAYPIRCRACNGCGFVRDDTPHNA